MLGPTRTGNRTNMNSCSSIMMCHLSILAILLACAHANPSHPHLIFIVADDLGWNDVGYHNPEIISPTIDKLAENGIKLNSSYVQPLCSPSRAALMTGVYPFRMGLSHIVIQSGQDVCLPLNQTILPQVLKANGYKTHAIGKWHLGFCKVECTPTYRGFDSFFGFYNGGEDYYQHDVGGGYDYRNNTHVNKRTGNYSTYDFADQAERIIHSHDPDTPLFLYLPFQSVHMPLQVPNMYRNLYPAINNKNRRDLSAMVTAMDDAILRIVKALQSTGLYEDSIIVFTADNGGWTSYGGNNYPLRGGKVTVFEGGTRAAAFIHSPLLQKKNFTYSGLIHAVDWYPTMASALGIEYHDTNDQDGVDLWESIINGAPSARNEIVYNLDFSTIPLQGQSAIRVGDYKLIEGYPGPYQSWYKPEDVDQGLQVVSFSEDEFACIYDTTSAVNATLGFRYLFNLKDDPVERINLYHKMPEVVKALRQRMADQAKKYVTPNYPQNNPKANPDNFGGVWSPGWC